jgi:hypothetical protein
MARELVPTSRATAKFRKPVTLWEASPAGPLEYPVVSATAIAGSRPICTFRSLGGVAVTARQNAMICGRIGPADRPIGGYPEPAHLPY